MASILPAFSSCNVCCTSTEDITFSQAGNYTLETIVELREVAASSLNLQATVGGTDGFIGLFIWDNDSVVADDGVTVICPSGYTGAGRWIKQI